ncbi:Fe-S cluster assembly protein SufD [Thiomicrorhabdus sp. ZW0627]|uniref:Fe-S cluster assembly protein SufD n=1 Tax=Thiomicrorhabdus sp. ZW0627 TaxID=3039774 RepID=UPI00243736F4|nr:Fe-S cluster assembly protein SufD [Thiomicrorhabdus sp. ZW0627]MDG6774036.1 Fe-S cluster assembly protein SufD [Thiomicrorhabdus sp. ZW0627]
MTTLSSSTRESKPLVKKFSPVVKAAMEHYAQLSDDLNKASDHENVVSLRQKAKQLFLQEGFPTRRDEDWGYTKLTNFVQTHYRLEGLSQITLADIQKFLPSYPATRIVMVDGWFSESLSDDLSVLPKGVSVESIDDILEIPASMDKLIGPQTQIDKEPFGVLNTMLLSDGYFLQVSRNTTVELPIFVLNVQTQNQHVSNLRNRIIIEQNAEATVVESYVSLTPEQNEEFSGLTNVVSEIEVGQDARFNQVVVQAQAERSYYFANQFVYQASRSVFNTLYSGTGSLTSRHQNHLQMDGEHIESIQNSACYASGEQIMDSRTYTEHNEVNGVSQQLHKYVLDDSAIGVFNGMIKVARAAQKTDGQMDNKNLLLSNSAQMDTKPQLEIYADDVKCSHGSATGQINKDQVFYLQARGIPKAQAIRMITEAFLLEPVEDIRNPEIGKWVSAILSQKLNG